MLRYSEVRFFCTYQVSDSSCLDPNFEATPPVVYGNLMYYQIISHFLLEAAPPKNEQLQSEPHPIEKDSRIVIFSASS